MDINWVKSALRGSGNSTNPCVVAERSSRRPRTCLTTSPCTYTRFLSCIAMSDSIKRDYVVPGSSSDYNLWMDVTEKIIISLSHMRKEKWILSKLVLSGLFSWPVCHATFLFPAPASLTSPHFSSPEVPICTPSSSSSCSCSSAHFSLNSCFFFFFFGLILQSG